MADASSETIPSTESAAGPCGRSRPAPEPTTVLIPALDEELAIARVIGEISSGRCHQIIVVDNGCRDRTAERARAAGAEVVREPRRGYGHACLAGLRRVRAGTEVIAFLDADGSDYPADLHRLTAPIYRGDCDLVIGTRMLDSESRRHLRLHQRAGNRAVLALVRLLYGARFSDLGPFRAIRASSIAALELRDRTWGWNLEMQLRAVALRLRVEEVPVRYRQRLGRSKISGSLVGSVRAGSRLLWTLVACLGRVRRPSRT